MWIDGRWYNEVELAAYIDTLKTELMAGSDVLKIRQLEKENAELKKFLKLAVEDLKTMANELSECTIGNHACLHCIYSEDCRDYFRSCDYVVPWMKRIKELINEGDCKDEYK